MIFSFVPATDSEIATAVIVTLLSISCGKKKDTFMLAPVEMRCIYYKNLDLCKARHPILLNL